MSIPENFVTVGELEAHFNHISTELSDIEEGYLPALLNECLTSEDNTRAIERLCALKEHITTLSTAMSRGVAMSHF